MNNVDYGRLHGIADVAKLAGGMYCPKCNRNDQKLFFGNPDGEHWCICCQIEKDFNLKEDKDE